MSNKKKKISSVYIFPVLFSIICLSYLFRYTFFNIETEIVKYDSIENVVRTEALIVRDEITVAIPAGVEISYKSSEGERVSSGKKILEISKSVQSDDNIAIKIKQLGDRINEIKQADINNNFFSKDKEKIEEQINEDVVSLKQIAKSGDFKKLDTVKESLAADLYKKSLIYGDGSFYGKNLEQLQKEKEALKKIYNNSIDVIYANTTGIVSYNPDGYEQILTPKNINNFEVDNIKEIMNSLKDAAQNNNEENLSGVKVVDNFEWYTCSLISLDQSKEFKEGKKIRLRFGELGNEEVNGEVYKLSQPKDDLCLIVIKINEQIDDFYKSRITEMDIIKAYNEGFTVLKKAIVVKDNIKGVYVIKNGIVRFIPVAVMEERDERCLVRNLNKEDSAFKSENYSLEVFDEVVVTTKRVKENQFLTDKI